MLKKMLFLSGIVLLLFSGCKAAEQVVMEPHTYSVLYNDKKDLPFQTDWLIVQEYQKRQNVTLDVRLGDDADYATALTQTLESGNIPDIVLKAYPNSVDAYASSGLLLPFSDYEDRMPNFMAYIKLHNLQGELDKLRMSDGKYYILPGYQRENQVQQWIYRQDIFEKHNLPMPGTYDELFDSLVTLKGLYPDSTPITATWGGAHLFAMMGAGYGIPAGWAGTNYYNVQADRWEYAPATENFKEMYTFLNRCYEAGILDPALFTQTPDEFTQKLVDGSAFVTVTWITSGFDNWNNTLEENGITGGKWVPFPVPASTMGMRNLPAVDPFRKGLVVPMRVVNEPYFEDLLKFLDWAVYSEEGMTLTTWGVEGVTFENTASGKAYLPDIKTPKNPEGTVNISVVYGFDMMFNLNENEEFEDYKKPADIVAFLDRSLKADETLPLNPKLVLDDNSVEALRIINENLDPYVAETSVKFITGELDISQYWDTYISELNNRGYTTIESLWNDAWVKQSK